MLRIVFQKLSERAQASDAEANKKAEEVVGTIRTVKAFNGQSGECVRFAELLDATLKINRVSIFTVP